MYICIYILIICGCGYYLPKTLFLSLFSEKEFHSKLGQLSETDPEFYTFLQKNDKSLFEILSDSESSSIEESEIDDSQDSDDNQDSDNMVNTFVHVHVLVVGSWQLLNKCTTFAKFRSMHRYC